MAICGMDKQAMEEFRKFVKKYLRKNYRQNHADATKAYFKKKNKCVDKIDSETNCCLACEQCVSDGCCKDCCEHSKKTE